jgi:cold shock CspA family protein
MFNAQKNFEFISQKGLPVDIYFRATSFSHNEQIRANTPVEYKLVKDKAGRIEAKAIKVIVQSGLGSPEPSSARAPRKARVRVQPM